VASTMPPELMSPEQRAARIAELQRELRRAWVVFMTVDWLVILVGVAILYTLITTRDLAVEEATPFLIVAGVIAFPFAYLYISRRIQPLQRELIELQQDQDSTA